MKTPIFEDLVTFIVEKTPSDEVLAFRPSARAQQRFEELSVRVKSGEATPEERAEMERNIELEHMMQLAKARAKILAQSREATSQVAAR